MDTTRDIDYDGTELNDAVTTVDGIEGTIVQKVRYGGVRGVGYSEKKATSDGRNASDVYQDGRTIQMEAVTHALTRGDLFDRWFAIVAALTPRIAYVRSPGDKGFLPLNFYIPTADVDKWGGLDIQCFIRCRPKAQPEWVVDRDAIGGSDVKKLALPWVVELEAIDPRIYVVPRIDVDIHSLTSPQSVDNRGNYPAPLNLILIIPASSGSVTFTLTGAGTDITLTIPDNAKERTVRVSSIDEVVTSQLAGEAETLAFSLLNQVANREYPFIEPGETANLAWTCTVTPGDGSIFWFYEALA